MKNSAKVLTATGYRDAFDPQTLQLHQQKAAVIRYSVFTRQLGRVIRFVHRLVKSINTAVLRRNAIQALVKLDDHQLLDIGLSRSKLDRLQRGDISLNELSRRSHEWSQREPIAKQAGNIRQFSQYKQPKQTDESEQPLLNRCG